MATDMTIMIMMTMMMMTMMMMIFSSQIRFLHVLPGSVEILVRRDTR